MTNTLKPYRSEHERSQGEKIGYAQGVEGHSAGLSGALSHNLAVACFGIIERRGNSAPIQDAVEYTEVPYDILRAYSRGDTLLGYKITDPNFTDMLIQAIRDKGASIIDIINLLVIANERGLAVKESSPAQNTPRQESPVISISMN